MINLITETMPINARNTIYIVWAEDANGNLAKVCSTHSKREADNHSKHAATCTPTYDTFPCAEKLKAYKDQCTKRAKYGPWTDQLAKVMSPKDYMEVKAFWAMMPGYSSFSSAFYSLMLAGDGEGTRVTLRAINNA